MASDIVSPTAELNSYGAVANGQKTELPHHHVQYVPKDKWHVVMMTMFLFGISSLLPWNFFIQANEYWMYKFRDINSNNTNTTTELQVTFSSYLSIASKVPYVLFLLVNVTVSQRWSTEKRIQYPLIVIILLFIATVIMVPINTDHNQWGFFGITMAIVVSINVLCGFVQGGGTGVAGSLPKAYMGYYVKGMALGGILASVFEILSIVCNSSPTSSAVAYFISASAVLLITLILFQIAIKTEFYTFYMSKQAGKKTQMLIPTTHTSNFDIFKKLWVYAISIIILFWAALSVLPAIIVRVQSVSSEKNIWTERLFIPVAGFLIFNICDLVGRILSEIILIPPKYRYLSLLLVILQIVFVPLIMLCNARPRYHLPVAFPSDASFSIIILFFALLNGFHCNTILAQAPKMVEVQHQEQAGSQMAFFLGLGLMLGSVTSYGTIKLL